MLASAKGNNWYACQTHRTLGRCFLALKKISEAIQQANRALELAQSIGDRQAICESRLLLAEASLLAGDDALAAANMARVSELNSSMQNNRSRKESRKPF